ncbi:MAG: hypothetical protein H6880_11330 [Rhodobiaceae bacterium]|nr:hypothetical protein [Rhodocyclaceae bacterium]MCC0042757.1 hypothetical protein [Rhodobiaceae bacterium]
MATAYNYPDAYLAKFCTEEREARAVDDVALFAASADVTFSADWAERLTIIQTYILAALENQADADDLFTAKLKAYRDQLAVELPRAVTAARALAETTSNLGLLSIPLERS